MNGAEGGFRGENVGDVTIYIYTFSGWGVCSSLNEGTILFWAQDGERVVQDMWYVYLNKYDERSFYTGVNAFHTTRIRTLLTHTSRRRTPPPYSSLITACPCAGSFRGGFCERGGFFFFFCRYAIVITPPYWWIWSGSISD